MTLNDNELKWRCHTPNLFREILVNPGTSALTMPLRLLGHRLHDLAELAIEIDDPRLHLMMMDLTLYDDGDPEKTPPEEIHKTRAELQRKIKQLEGKPNEPILERYDVCNSGAVYKDENGYLVEYDEALALISELQRKIKQLEGKPNGPN
tara:strand:- start:1880 stop:2329 length:450 start_codon:yes stop_codon:yes gene_type:complete